MSKRRGVSELIRLLKLRMEVVELYCKDNITISNVTLIISHRKLQFLHYSEMPIVTDSEVLETLRLEAERFETARTFERFCEVFELPISQKSLELYENAKTRNMKTRALLMDEAYKALVTGDYSEIVGK